MEIARLASQDGCRLDRTRAVGAGVDTPDDDLTDDHMRLLEWLNVRPTGSLVVAARALGLDVTDVEALCADLVNARMIEQVRAQ